MKGIPAHRYDRDYHTCWCGKPWLVGIMEPENDTDGPASGRLRKTAGRKSVPRSWIRRRQRGLALWIKKHLTRAMTRLEHGHGPGTLTRFGGTYPGYEWTCGRCGGKAEW